MKAGFNAQIENVPLLGKKFSIQFETDDYSLYKQVEKVCQKCVDKSDKYNKECTGC